MIFSQLVQQLLQGSILAAVVILLVANLVVMIFGLRQLNLRSIWLIALAGVNLAFLLVIAARVGIPYQIVLVRWQPASQDLISLTSGLFTSSPLISVDHISWTFGYAISVLLLGVLFTAVSRLPGLNWRAWGGSLTFTAFGLLAIVAGNPLTVLLAWAALDLVEVFIWLINITDPTKQRNIIILLCIRLLGLIVFLIASLLDTQNGSMKDFESISILINPYLILAVCIRLGVMPFQIPFLQEFPVRQGLGTILSMIPFAASLVILIRTASVGVNGVMLPFFIVLSLLVALYSSIAWVRARNELAGKPYWLLATACMAVISAVLRQPLASLAWGVISILMGGFIFVRSNPHRNLVPLLYIAAFGISMLPFSPLWLQVDTYTAVWSVFPIWAALGISVGLAAIHALLVFGFMRHGLILPAEKSEPEQWIWLFYVPGLFGILLAGFAWGWINRPDLENLHWLHWLAGPVVCILTALLWIWSYRNPGMVSTTNNMSGWKTTWWGRLISFQWVSLLVRQILKIGNYMFRLSNAILEGEGGVIWTLLLLLIFFSLVVQSGQVK